MPRAPTASHDYRKRNGLVMDHLRLVTSVAAGVAIGLPAQVEAGELVSVGFLGLIDAA